MIYKYFYLIRLVNGKLSILTFSDRESAEFALHSVCDNVILIEGCLIESKIS